MEISEKFLSEATGFYVSGCPTFYSQSMKGTQVSFALSLYNTDSGVSPNSYAVESYVYVLRPISIYNGTIYMRDNGTTVAEYNDAGLYLLRAHGVKSGTITWDLYRLW